MDAYHHAAGAGLSLTLTCSNAPPNGIGWLLLGFPDPLGTQIPPLGVTAHLLVGGPIATLAALTADPRGFASHTIVPPILLPLPPGFAAQAVWLQGCPPFVASDALWL